ncbi:hypothetical protein CHU98_g3841 [Xylaria longipes]|nr:hypothetical protein CHU98_g3841 [Xylaria longipes]
MLTDICEPMVTSVTHEDDIENANTDDYRLRLHGPFAYSVQRVSKEFRDAKAYRIGAFSELITQRDNLEARDAKNIRKLLAMRALLDKRPNVLRFCLDKGGFEYDETFKDEANKTWNQEHPETFGVLEASEFRRIHPRGGNHPSAVFDAGGALPVDW